MKTDSRRLLLQIRELVLSARATAVRSVDTIQVWANFEIGRRIVEQEQSGAKRAEYGERVLKEISNRLVAEFGKGFSLTNLKLMRRFYVQNLARIGQTVSGQLTAARKGQTVSDQLVRRAKGQTGLARTRPFTLSWSHYVFLLGVKDEAERSFYEIEAGQQNWSLRELRRQFDAGLYERLALSRDRAGIRKLAQEGQVIAEPRDLIKESCILEFLGLPEEARYSENDLEAAIIGRLEHFLLELGKGFLFEARQKRFTFNDEHFFVDLVLYNRLLRCYVLFDLKIGRLTHQDLGQMQMYVNYYDRKVRLESENPTIGLILCKMKNSALVELTLPPNANIFASEYKLYLPSKAELKRKLLEWAGEGKKAAAKAPRPTKGKRNRRR